MKELLWVSLSVVLLGVGCGRGSTTGPRVQPPAGEIEANASGDAGEVVRDALTSETSGDGGAADESVARASDVRGRVVVVEGNPGGKALLAVPDSDSPPRTAKVDDSGRFRFLDVEPATYRLILPADGLHATADMYVTVAPDAGLDEVTISRGRGCPVKIVVRDHAMKAVPGAELELTLTDLPQVRAPHVSRGVTDAKGRFVLVGSCVRGFYEGFLKVSGRGSFPLRHGYVGTGWDQFDIVLPGGPDAGVSYTNDD